jgi:cyclophilin family peptidyl-prolyl cis-trans isomerase
MNIFRLSPAAFILPLILLSGCRTGNNKNIIISVKTTHGDFKLKLYDETPLHRDNFIGLVNSSYYEGISFHRLIKGFMVQAGDYSTKKRADPVVADSIGALSLPPEFVPGLFHKRGALAAARQDNSINPEMRSSSTQFYIVEGSKMSESEFSSQEQERDNNIKQGEFIRVFMHMSDSCKKAGLSLTPGEIQEHALLRLYDMPDKALLFKTTEIQRSTYMSVGGVPRLDGTYTVFGEVVEGMETIDRIASVRTNPDDSPTEYVGIIKMKIVKK